jgi:hypothetical protein
MHEAPGLAPRLQNIYQVNSYSRRSGLTSSTFDIGRFAAIGSALMNS